MKHFFSLSLLILLFLMSCQTQPTLTEEEQNNWKYQTARYWEKMPKKANESSKFEEEFDDYYLSKAKAAQLSQWKVGTNDTIYLEIRKTAPSLTPKQVAIGIKLVENEGTLLYYEEGYRTWKLEAELLDQRASILFNKWVHHQDLTPYFSVHHEDEYIEFPSDEVQYDTYLRKWTYP